NIQDTKDYVKNLFIAGTDEISESFAVIDDIKSFENRVETITQILDEIKSIGIWYLVHGNKLKGLRKAFVAKVGEHVGRSAAKYIGKAIPLVEDLITLYECYREWDRIWRQDHGEGFLDTIIGLIYHCTNRPIVSFDFDLCFPIIDGPQIHGEVDVYLAPRFLLPWPFSSYCPHDINIWLNNWLAANFTMTVPHGHYGLQIDPAYVTFPSGGTARNRVTIATRHLNGGNFVVATGMLLSIVYRRVRTYLVASSLEEATSKINELMSSKFANKIDPAVFPEDIKIASNLIEGMQKLNVTIWNLGATLAFQVPIQVFDGENLIAEVLVTLPPFQSATFTVDWNATVGEHRLRVIVDPFNTRDEMSEHNNQAFRDVTVYETDRTPPTTTLHVFGPYRTRDGYVQITPEAGFWFTSQDNIGGSGVSMTLYRIRNATYNSGWIIYQNPFYIPTPVEGTYYIDYYSIDNKGNIETVKTTTIVVSIVLWRIDVAITSIMVSTNETYVGRMVTITLVVANYGELPQTFNVTAYYNSTAIKSVTINNLIPNTSTIIIIAWNTSKVEPHHNYTISASIPTIPYESDVSNNLLIDGIVKIKKFADVNGDGKIDLKDIALVARAFGTRDGNPKWDPRCDINGDGKVDIRDLLLVARRLWQ
ncbi:MAG: CARDB domain-containing protein, partial [Candidatus Bathyarchaeia archaeon]